MMRNRPRTFLEVADRRARAEVLHDMVANALEPVKKGRHCRLNGLSWVIYRRYVKLALEMGLIETSMTKRGDPQWRKKPEVVYIATEKGRAWAKMFWDASKPLYGLGDK